MHCSAGFDAEAAPVLLSLDCEMCETSTSKRELIGLSLVNSAGSTVLKVIECTSWSVRIAYVHVLLLYTVILYRFPCTMRGFGFWISIPGLPP